MLEKGLQFISVRIAIVPRMTMMVTDILKFPRYTAKPSVSVHS